MKSHFHSWVETFKNVQWVPWWVPSSFLAKRRGNLFTKKDNWWIIKSLKPNGRQSYKGVSKNEFLFEASKWKLLRLEDGRAKIIFFYTYIWKKADHTKGFVRWRSLSEGDDSRAMQQPFWGYEIWLGHSKPWLCFIMLHWIFYLIDSRALVKNVHSYLFLPSNREVYRGVNCPFTH